jgi:hypothetical protein
MSKVLVSLAILASITLSGCSGGGFDNPTGVDAATDAPMTTTLDAGTPDAQTTTTGCLTSWQQFPGVARMEVAHTTSPNDPTYMAAMWGQPSTGVRLMTFNQAGNERLADATLQAASCEYNPMDFIIGTASGYLAETCAQNGAGLHFSLTRMDQRGVVERQSPLTLNMNGFASHGVSTVAGESVAGASWNFLTMSANIKYGEVADDATVPVAHSIEIPFANCGIMGGIAWAGSSTAIAATYFDLQESKAHLSVFFQNGTDPAHKVDIAQPVPVADLQNTSCYQFYEVYSISTMSDGRVVALYSHNGSAKSASLVSPNGEIVTLDFNVELTDLNPVPGGYVGAYQDRPHQTVGAIQYDENFTEIKRWTYPSNVWRFHSWETPKVEVQNANRFMLAWIDASGTANLTFHDECIIVE